MICCPKTTVFNFEHFFGTRRWFLHFSQGTKRGKHSGQPELFYASGRDVAQVRQDDV
jgi:hypothetical protein